MLLTRSRSLMPGSSTRIWLSPRPYSSIIGSLTPSVSTRSRMVSMACWTVFSSRAVSTSGFMVSVKLLSAPPPVRSYSLEYLASSRERTALALAGAMPSTRIDFRLGRIGLVDLRKAQVGRLQVLLDARHGVVGLGADRFRHHHLQNQVSAAAQIQTQVNPAGSWHPAGPCR